MHTINLCILPPGIYRNRHRFNIEPRAADAIPCFISIRVEIIFFNVPLNKLRGINIGWDRRRLYATMDVTRSLNALYSVEFV